jgi:queuine/archaeosine tRNA-ribosyltransferase
MLLTEINLSYYQGFMEDMRRAIAVGQFDVFCDAWRIGEVSGTL